MSPRFGLTDSESGWADSESGQGRQSPDLMRNRNRIRGGPNTPICTKGLGQGLCEQREMENLHRRRSLLDQLSDVPSHLS